MHHSVLLLSTHVLAPDANATTGKVVMAVGQSVPLTGPHNQSGIEARAGLLAAFATANGASGVQFELVTLDDASDGARQQANIRQLLCTGASGTGPVFAIAGTVGSSASEADLSVLKEFVGSDGVPVPFVGGQTNSEVLRTQSAVLQNSRTGVVFVRASAGDEINAIVSQLAKNWTLLNHTSVFYEDTAFGRSVVDILSTTLRSVGGTALLSSYGHSVVTSTADINAVTQEAVKVLCQKGNPMAVVLAAPSDMSGALIRALSDKGLAHMTFAALSELHPKELFRSIPMPAWMNMVNQESVVYFSQVVPNPASLSTFRIVTEFKSAMAKYQPGISKSHAALEGFIAGRLITMAVSRSLELNEWPLTRATFLDTIFRDIRTFDIFGDYTLGPYGDGVGSKGAQQTSDDWCNQGAHDLFMTYLDMGSGNLIDQYLWSYKFSGCSTGWNDTATKALVGFNEYTWNTVINENEGTAVGLFISAVIASMEESAVVGKVTAQMLLDAIYATRYFKIDNKLSVGPFIDGSSGERLCNQGMDTIYIVEWTGTGFQSVSFSAGTERCGAEFDPPKPNATNSDNTDRTVILSTTIPGFVIVCSLILVAVAIQRSGRATLKKLKRSELEIGERIGKGQFGTVHNGDWHGTPVAIRVIDKTEITHEDLQAIKSEMMLTHSLHHPNLLMMLGYSETKTDLLIVSEYMASGSLHEYLKKNSMNMNYYNKVAIAFDTIKGLAYLHSAKPPVVHGNLSSQSLMIDGSMVTKICDFWCSKKGKNSSSATRRHSAFGIVLWELFIPAELYSTMTDSSKSSSVSPAHSTSTQAVQGGVELQQVTPQQQQQQQQQQQGAVPEIHPSTPKEVATLLNRCWQKEPERRPSVFQILRNWPQTFASVGVFEMPTDLSVSSPQTPRNLLSEVSVSIDGRDASDDEMMVSVLPQGLTTFGSETPTLSIAPPPDHNIVS
eukprot:m51a1_g7001 putative serine threonine-protein kinase ctr1-like (951) ;mRNA; f:204455-208750